MQHVTGQLAHVLPFPNTSFYRLAFQQPIYLLMPLLTLINTASTSKSSSQKLSSGWWSSNR